jgi:DNA-binding response OmpR family regulator
MILDIHLPKVSGKDILLYIRSNERLEDMRVIIVSADAALAESLRGEADLVLTKPISFHQLRELSARLRP